MCRTATLTLYFADLVGLSQAQAAVKKDPTKAPNISGITTPDSSTIVFHLTKPSSIGVIDALSLPVSSPVPQGYAAKFDSKTPTSTYGQHQIDVGPYYISSYRPASRSSCCATRTTRPARTSGRPTWTRSSSRRASRTTNSAVTKILTGSSMVNFDFDATGEALKTGGDPVPEAADADAVGR